MLDPEVFGAGLAEIIRAQVAGQTAELRQELAAARAELAELRGVPALDAGAVRQMIDDAIGGLPSIPEPPVPPDVGELVRMAVEALPAAKDGKDIDPEALRALVRAEVVLQVAQSPAPKDGDSVDLEVVGRQIAELVDAAVKALPAPKDGVGVAGAVIDRGGQLILTLSDGRTCDLGLVVGANGKSAFGDIDFDVALKDDDRTIVFRMTQGDIAQSYELAAPWPLDQGIWSPDLAYVKGDGCSWGGDFYLAQIDAPTGKPGEGGGWRRAVKRGRDGKDFNPDATPRAARDPRIKS